MSDPQLQQDDAVIGKALRGSLVAIVVIGMLVGGGIWYANRPEKIDTTDPDKVDLPDERQQVVEIPKIPFADVTAESGIEFLHHNGAYGEKLLPETMGGGCAFLDFDHDGDQDLLLVNSRRWPDSEYEESVDPRSHLYENDGTGKFTDVSSKWNMDVSMYGMGVAIGDYDNDGDADVFFTAVGSNRLMRNEGDRFVDVTSNAGVAGERDRWSSSAAWFDFDNDGDLDLFVCNYVNWSKEIDLQQNFQLTGIGRAYGPPNSFEGTFSYLYRNDGDGHFTDVSAESGIKQTNAATGRPLGKSLGVAPLDLNRDGWMDFVVANDTVRNFVFVNQKNGRFQEVGVNTGVAYDSQGKARGAMGIDAAYFLNDDCIGIAIANFANEMTGLYVCNSAELHFADDAIVTGLGPPTRLDLSFGLFFADLDLDGRLDILSANGHLENEINQVQSSQHYRQPTRLFWNADGAGNSLFVKLTSDQLGHEFENPIVGRGATYADIDDDGDLDVLLTQIGGSPLLLRNDLESERRYLRIQLQGTKSNRDAIGAWVECKTDQGTIRRQVMPTRSYLSQVELPMTIGLGESNVQQLTVIWPNGDRQRIVDFELNRTINIIEE